MSDIRTVDYGAVVIRWDHGLPATQWGCPYCGSTRVHLTSDGRGIICGRTRECGFAPFVQINPAGKQAVFHPGEPTS
jgi:hypothetical protein